MRIVLDNNVLGRAAKPSRGPARELLILCVEPPHVLLSPFMISELKRVLGYERMRKLHGLDDAGIEQYILNIQSAASIVAFSVGAQAAIVVHDPQDDPIVHTAVAGGAEILCTRDHHLRHAAVVDYCRTHGIEVLGDIELLARFRAADEWTNDADKS